MAESVLNYISVFEAEVSSTLCKSTQRLDQEAHKLMKNFVALIFVTLVLLANRAIAQANETENQRTFLYVDANLGSDTNSGAQSSPFKTIQVGVNKANAINQTGVGVKVVVNPGVYREFVNIGNYKTTNATFTLQAAITGTAIIAGSDVLTGWTQAGDIYSRAWINQSLCSVPSGWPNNFAQIALHTEMIFVNGSPLT